MALYAVRFLAVVLLAVFLVLKLTGQVTWSWWWVASPLWIPLALGVAAWVLQWVVIAILSITDTPPP